MHSSDSGAPPDLKHVAAKDDVARVDALHLLVGEELGDDSLGFLIGTAQPTAGDHVGVVVAAEDLLAATKLLGIEAVSPIATARAGMDENGAGLSVGTRSLERSVGDEQ
jgi:hypothetical protein